MSLINGILLVFVGLAIGSAVSDFTTFSYKNYEASIIGILGFAGVIMTLQHSARLSKQERQEDKEHQCNVFRRSILEELKYVKEIFVSNLDGFAAAPRTPTSYMTVCLDELDLIFGAQRGSIGLLEPDELTPVLKAYGSLSAFKTNATVLAYQVNGFHARIAPPAYLHLESMYKSGLVNIEAAIGALEG